MKIFVEFSLAVFLAAFLSTSLVAATRYEVKFVEVKSFQIDESQIPPTLSVTFDLRCNQTLQEVIRKNIAEGLTNVAVGILVLEDTALDCDRSITTEKRAPGGQLFSGVPYEVSLIKSDTP
jgi:hypothetical protein